MAKTETSHYKVQPYFLHMRLLLSLIGVNRSRSLEDRIARISDFDNLARKALIDDELTGHAMALISTNKIAPLEELLLTNHPQVGQLVTSHLPFYYKGAGPAAIKQESGKKAYASFRAKLPDFDDLEVQGQFSAEHFTYSSSAGRLSGRCTRFMLARVEAIGGGILKLRPILIGDRFYVRDDQSIFVDKNALRIYPEDISEFSKLASFESQVWNIERMRTISEKQIKEWFAEIVHEDFVPKDWGGEQSDLYTTRVTVRGNRASTAFLLKGPAKFHPLSIKDLGANGDQIVRLFQEPADVHIVQHCHFIKPQVLHHLDAFASRPYARSLYCAVDGVDTLRILTGYGYLADGVRTKRKNRVGRARD